MKHMRPTVARELARRFRAQHGVISRSQLYAMGSMTRLCATGWPRGSGSAWVVGRRGRPGRPSEAGQKSPQAPNLISTTLLDGGSGSLTASTTKTMPLLACHLSTPTNRNSR